MAKLPDLDWSLVQAFLAVAKTGRLSGAARRLGTSQPTLGRQIKQIEQQLEAELFDRQPQGLALTDIGAAVAGRQARLAGTVRITASVSTSALHLLPIIARIRKLEPQTAIELVPSDDSRNMLYREADIAVWMYRPTQLDLVTQHIGDIALAVFASNTYLAERGAPHTAADLLQHDFVGFDASNGIIEGFHAAGVTVDRDFFKIRCDDTIAYWELVRAGCGIGFAQAGGGRADPLVSEIDIGMPLPVLPVWLTAHAAMHRTPGIRRIWDLLAAGLRPLVS